GRCVRGDRRARVARAIEAVIGRGDAVGRYVIEDGDQRLRRTRGVVRIGEYLRIARAVRDEGQIAVGDRVRAGIARRVENAAEIELVARRIEVGDVAGVPGQDIEDESVAAGAARHHV